MSKNVNAIDALHTVLLALVAGRSPICIGLDGLDGVGKTTIARGIGRLLNGTVISLDDHLDEKKNAYAPHIRCEELRRAMEPAVLTIVEGICLRDVAHRCGFVIDIHVYVRRLSSISGLWHDEEIALGENPAEAKENERELRRLADQLGGGSDEDGGHEPDLRDELIDYHARWKPVRHADVLFDIRR